MTGNLVLITGATGFVGFRVLVLLLEAGYNVRAAVRSTAGFEKIKTLPSAAPYASQMEPVIVPDITVPGAYDEAVKGVKYIIHMASPFASRELQESTDFERSYIQPATQGTVGILDSAAKVAGIERVVITASVLSIMSFGIAGTDSVVNETHRSATSQGPFDNWAAAYSASKARAFEASKKWMEQHSPSFDLVNILPVFIVGRDETVSSPNEILKAANGIVMGPLLGHPSDTPYPGIPVHVDDVAMMHVRSLERTIPGNEDYLAASHPLLGTEWGQSFDIVKKHFPDECAAGVFKVDSTEKPKSLQILVDNAKAEKTFGFTFRSYEEHVVSVAGQYLELLGNQK